MNRRLKRTALAAVMLRGAIGSAIAAFALSSCAFDNWHADIGDFVERGLSLTKLVSFEYAQSGSGRGKDVAHGSPVTVSLRILNPKELDLAYALTFDETLVEPGSVSEVAAGKTADGYTDTTFTFTPTALAEHGDVKFSLAMRSPSINKDFEKGSVSVRCDCAPDPVASIVAGPRSDGRACVGFTLPEGYPNADIERVRISYSSPTAGTNETVTEKVSRTGAGLTQAPDVALVDAAAESYPRYYLPADVVAGNPYTFTVVLIDESGKESPPATANVAGNEVTLSFDANGASGSVGARFGFNGTTVAIPGGTTLSMEGGAFAGWNTARDGSGTTYMPGSIYVFGMTGQTLYAQWTKLGEIQVTVLNPTYRTLGFTRAGHRITSTYLDIEGKITLSLPSNATACQWYRDGVALPSETLFWYSFTPHSIPTPVGNCVISVAATFDGVRYSGDLTVTVTDEYMVTILPKNQEATFTQTSFTNPASWSVTESFEHTLTRPYQLGRYEVSYRLWTDVKTWAIANGYTFTSVSGKGQMGAGSSPTENHPVTFVPDLEAMVWCNAYSKMTGAKPCYYMNEGKTIEARNTNDLFAIRLEYSSKYVDWGANGYRLPTRGEWFYAASCGGLYPFNHVSGCETEPSTNAVTSAYYANVRTGATTLVKSKYPNAWGLYNMSGNVWEFCFDKYEAQEPSGAQTDYVSDTGTLRVTNGGSFSTGHQYAESSIGFKPGTEINGGYADDGFRLARSIQ